MGRVFDASDINKLESQAWYKAEQTVCEESLKDLRLHCLKIKQLFSNT